MKANDLCPAPHLEAADLDGRDVTVTIKSIGFAEVGEEKKNKGVIYFDEMPRGMVINRTNLKRIIGLHGKDTDTWIGKRITLYTSEASFKGNIVPCIRVRDQIPK